MSDHVLAGIAFRSHRYRQPGWWEAHVLTVLAPLPGLMVALTSVSFDVGWLGILGGFLVAVAGAWAVWRKIEPERRKLQAETKRLNTQAAEIEDRIKQSLLEDLEKDRQQARLELAEARADAAQARSEAAEAQAELAHRLSEWEKQKSELLDQIRAKDRKIAVLERKVERLEEEVRSLRIANDLEDGRRRDDHAQVQDSRLDRLESDGR